MIPQLAGNSYSDTPWVLKIPTLCYNRARGEMVECYVYFQFMEYLPNGLKPAGQRSRLKDKTAQLEKKKNQHRRPATKTSSQ